MALNGEPLNEESLNRINELTEAHFKLNEFSQKIKKLESENQLLKSKHDKSATIVNSPIKKSNNKSQNINKSLGFESLLISSERARKNKPLLSEKEIYKTIKEKNLILDSKNKFYSENKIDTKFDEIKNKQNEYLEDNLDESKKDIFKKLEEADNVISNLKNKQLNF